MCNSIYIYMYLQRDNDICCHSPVCFILLLLCERLLTASTILSYKSYVLACLP